MWGSVSNFCFACNCNALWDLFLCRFDATLEYEAKKIYLSQNSYTAFWESPLMPLYVSCLHQSPLICFTKIVCPNAQFRLPFQCCFVMHVANQRSNISVARRPWGGCMNMYACVCLTMQFPKRTQNRPVSYCSWISSDLHSRLITQMRNSRPVYISLGTSTQL